MEEKQNSVELTDKGNDFVAQKDPSLFILEQLDEIIRRIDEDESLSFDEKASKKKKPQLPTSIKMKNFTTSNNC